MLATAGINMSIPSNHERNTLSENRLCSHYKKKIAQRGEKRWRIIC